MLYPTELRPRDPHLAALYCLYRAALGAVSIYERTNAAVRGSPSPHGHRSTNAGFRLSLRSARAAGREAETADVAALSHAFVQLHLASGVAGHERKIEVTDHRVLHRELVKYAIIRLDRRRAANVFGHARVVAELIHQ